MEKKTRKKRNLQKLQGEIHFSNKQKTKNKISNKFISNETAFKIFKNGNFKNVRKKIKTKQDKKCQ